jgi:hypothetical protein
MGLSLRLPEPMGLRRPGKALFPKPVAADDLSVERRAARMGQLLFPEEKKSGD